MIRWIRRFFPRLQEQLNILTGLATIGAFLLAVGGVLVSGTLRSALIALGIVIAIITLIVSVVRAWPPHARAPAAVEGQELPIAELEAIYPRVPAIGILGAGAVGKTTVKNRLLQLPTRGQTLTQRVTARVSPLLHDPTIYVAIVDGRGESYIQQFEIAERADILIVLLDHNDIETPKPNTDRMASHRAFGKQVRDYLTQRSRKGSVHVLLNKKDLWERAEEHEQVELRAFFKGEVDLWKAAYGNVVTEAEHSNASPNDIAYLVAAIQEHWSRLQVERRALASK